MKTISIAKTKSHHVVHCRENGGIPGGPPIAPAVLSRCPVFQPRFKNLRTGAAVWETPWARVTVTGRLGGIHRKVLDAIFATALKTKRIEGGAQMMVIDPYRVAKLIGISKSHPGWLLSILRDMQSADVIIEDKITGLRHWAHIVSEMWESKRRAAMPGGALTGDRPLYVVTISSGWMKIFDTSMIIKYRNVLPVLSRIESGAVHALALHILTHSGGSFDAENVLSIVGAITPDTSDRHHRRLLQEIVKEAARLAQLGMQLYRHSATNHLMIAYTPTGAVHAQNPKSK